MMQICVLIAWIFAILVSALMFASVSVQAQSWPGPTFHEFCGENNGDPSDSLIGNGLDWNRPGFGYYPDTYCIYWGYIEPSPGTWDLTHLTNYGSLIQSWPTGSSNTLVLLDGWPSWEPSTNPSVWLPDWTNYMNKVVSYLYAPPFNCRYFQVWNEAFPNNGGYWSDSNWSNYFKYVHLPASQVIHSYPGAKVVYGGYPSRYGASVSDYTNQLTIYNAWPTVDVLDLHYYTPYQWSRLRAAADNNGFTNMAIWQSEVGVGGYSSQPNSFIANEYTRAFAWALTNNWNMNNKYKWIYYSSWATDGSGLYTGSLAALTCHGQQLQELVALLGTNLITPYFGITGSLPGLSQASLPNNSTSIESVRTGNKIIIFVHLSPGDWTNNSTVNLTFPIANNLVTSAQRIDLAGALESLTTSGTMSTTVSVSTHDATGSSALAWNNVSLATGRAATFYLLLTINDGVPGKIESENYTVGQDMQTMPCSDADGGYQVGYTSTGSYMDYNVNVATSGTYNVDLRVATANSNTQLKLMSGSAVLATVNVPSTGGWNNWQTVTAKGVNLAAGIQTLRVVISVPAINLNWLNFTLDLPNPWSSADIGSVGIAGTASYSNDVFIVQGSGADIWGTADAFQYVWQMASGDCSVTAKILNMQNTDPWAKAGVMIRESLTASSTHAMMMITPGQGSGFEYRAATGGATVNALGAAVAAPYWLRVKRTGNSFSGYISSDGNTWTQVGATQTITMANNTYVGLCLTSHANAILCTAAYTNVTTVP